MTREYSILLFLSLIAELSNNSTVARLIFNITPNSDEIRLELVTTVFLDTVSEGREFAGFFFGYAFIWRGRNIRLISFTLSKALTALCLLFIISSYVKLSLDLIRYFDVF